MLQLVHTTMLHNFQLAQFVVLGLDVVHQYGEAAQSRRAAGVRRGPFARRADASAARQRAVHVWRATIFHQLAAHWCSAGLCWRHVGGHVHVLAYAPRPPTRASAIAPPTPALSGPGHARAAPALLQEWHPRCQPAGRTSRVAGPVLFACGDYSSRCAHISNPAHQSAHTRADSALFDHGPPQQETADRTCTCACACECVARRMHTRRAVGRGRALLGLETIAFGRMCSLLDTRARIWHFKSACFPS